eukprot:scaffold20382_cov129-Isochrysis_galbana.AAC.4
MPSRSWAPQSVARLQQCTVAHLRAPFVDFGALPNQLADVRGRPVPRGEVKRRPAILQRRKSAMRIEDTVRGSRIGVCSRFGAKVHPANGWSAKARGRKNIIPAAITWETRSASRQVNGSGMWLFRWGATSSRQDPHMAFPVKKLAGWLAG